MSNKSFIETRPTDKELNDNRFPVGKYVGYRIDNIPMNSLAWYLEEDEKGNHDGFLKRDHNKVYWICVRWVYKRCRHCEAGLKELNHDWSSRKYHKKCWNKIQKGYVDDGFYEPS